MNKVIIMGRLTRDPEFRQTTSGIPSCRFSVAVNRSYKNKQTGERVEETDFIDCDAWRQQAEFISRYFAKGSMILVDGQLRNNNWTDNNGQKRTNAEVVADNVYFGESKRDSEGSGSYNGNSYAGGNNGYSNRSYNDNSYAPSNGYNAPNQGYNAPNQGYAPAAPTAPAASDFAMLEEDDSELPF